MSKKGKRERSIIEERAKDRKSTSIDRVRGGKHGVTQEKRVETNDKEEKIALTEKRF